MNVATKASPCSLKNVAFCSLYVLMIEAICEWSHWRRVLTVKKKETSDSDQEGSHDET